MKRPVILDLGVDDLAQLQRVMDGAFDPRFGEAWSSAQCLAVLALPGYAVRVALVESVMAGFAITRHVMDESELLLLAVDPALRRRGVAAALIEDWIARVTPLGVTRLFLEMRTDNDARHLYEHFGFSDIALRRNYYRGIDGMQRDAVTMEKHLV